MTKKTILGFQEMKEKGKKIAGIVVYDYWNAKFAEEAKIDWLLVGDSVGMSVLGLPNTIPVTMDEMMIFAKAVRRGAPNTFIIGDMPFMSYQIGPRDAVINAGRFYKEAGTDAIKLEGGQRVVEEIKAIVNAGMNVMGHIGLTPQSSGQFGGFKAQGRTAESALLVIKDALAVEKAGAFALLVEAVPPEVTQIISQNLEIPVLSIGAGPLCDGQLLLKVDLLGESEIFTPKFVKKYAELAETIRQAFKNYTKEVKAKIFPDIEHHCYKMLEGEIDKLRTEYPGFFTK
jgi:3-methyl-2-oxobutanoate hydroxymethyltransferase